jgi:hypothetical protein
MVLSPDGKQSLADQITCRLTENDAVEAARQLAHSFLQRGALQIIAAIG